MVKHTGIGLIGTDVGPMRVLKVEYWIDWAGVCGP